MPSDLLASTTVTLNVEDIFVYYCTHLYKLLFVSCLRTGAFILLYMRDAVINGQQ